MNSKNLSIIIPCFNEPDNIRLLIQRLKEVQTSYEGSIEFILVDGCSTDHTQSVIQDEFKGLNQDVYKSLLMKKRSGYGYDIGEGLKIARGQILAWTHADMQTDPMDIIEALRGREKEVLGNSIIIKGCRKKRPLLDIFLTFGMQIVVFLFLKVSLSDINAQPKVFSRYFFEQYFKNSPSDFSLDLFVLYKAKINKWDIVKHPVDFSKRIFGEAKGGGGTFKNRFKLIKRTLKYIRSLSQSC